ncbi:Os01g0937012, partial [Oryza sativa Japonica Group]
AELLLLLVEHHQVVLHLVPADHHRRAVPDLLRPHLDEREARRGVVHLHQRVAAEDVPRRAVLEVDVDVRHGVAEPVRADRPALVAQLERRHRRRHLLRPLQDLVPRLDERAVHVGAELGVRNHGAQLDDEWRPVVG